MGLLAKKACMGVAKLGPTPTVLAELRSWSFAGDAEEIDVSTMGSCVSTTIGGRVTERLEFTCYLADPEDAAQIMALAGAAPLDFELFPFGETIGQLKITGQLNVLNRTESGDIGGAVELAFAGTTPAAAVRGVAP